MGFRVNQRVLANREKESSKYRIAKDIRETTGVTWFVFKLRYL